MNQLTIELDYKSLAKIKRLDVRAKIISSGFLQGMHKSSRQGFSKKFSEYRRYGPGDDPKLIDWKLYAKTDKYYVKKFEAEAAMTAYLILDISASMDYRSPASTSKYDYSASLAAALAYLMIRQHDSVGLIAFSEKVQWCLSAKNSVKHFLDLTACLASLKPSGSTCFAECLNRINGQLPKKCLIILFSDLLELPSVTINSLSGFRHAGHDVLLFHVLDRAELELPFEGIVEFEDPETGRKIETNTNHIRHRYKAEVSRFRQDVRHGCARHRIKCISLTTDMPFDQALSMCLPGGI